MYDHSGLIEGKGKKLPTGRAEKKKRKKRKKGISWARTPIRASGEGKKGGREGKGRTQRTWERKEERKSESLHLLIRNREKKKREEKSCLCLEKHKEKKKGKKEGLNSCLEDFLGMGKKRGEKEKNSHSPSFFVGRGGGNGGIQRPYPMQNNSRPWGGGVAKTKAFRGEKRRGSP